MALIIKDRVQETSTTSGTGTLTLAGAVTGYQSFASAIGSGNTTYYAIYETQTNNWEVGIGTVGSGTLARTTVLASSNAGSLVSFGGGQLAVWGDYPAGQAVIGNGTSILAPSGALLPVANGGTGVSSATGTGSNPSVVLSQQPQINSPVITSYSTSTVPLKVYGLNGQITELFDVYTYNGGTLAFQINGSGAITTGTWNATPITNSYLANSSITINGTATSLGGSINVGTVTSVSGTAPVVSSGGSTPTISMAAANSTTNGYLTSTDWNTFNNKSPAAGSTSIVTVGTITTGVWNGTAIANSYLANSSITINGTPVSLGGSTTVSASAGGSNTQVQYNSSGTFAGSANMTFDGTSLTAGNLISTNGLYGKATFTGSYTDGIVVDYSTGNGRISVGTSDTLTFYNGGLANTTLGSFSTSGLLQAVGGFQAPSTGPFFLNATTISANFTVPSNYNAVTAGKVTINTGVTVTVSTGSRWVVV